MAQITVQTWDDGDRWGYRFSLTENDQFVAESGQLTKTLIASEDDARLVAFNRAASVSVAAPVVTAQSWTDDTGEWVAVDGPAAVEPVDQPADEVAVDG